MSPLGAGPLEPDSTPGALPGGTAPDIAVPTLPSAGPAESAGHSVTLPPRAAHPRYLRLIQDGQFPQWWRAMVESSEGQLLAYCATWSDAPRVKLDSFGAGLFLDRTQLRLSREEVELLRPLCAHGLIIEEMAS